jgi:hypothetical protein
MRRAANVLSKQYQTGDKGWSSRFGVWRRGLKTPHVKKSSYEMLHTALEVKVSCSD